MPLTRWSRPGPMRQTWLDLLPAGSKPHKSLAVYVQVTRERISTTLEKIRGLADEMALIKL